MSRPRFLRLSLLACALLALCLAMTAAAALPAQSAPVTPSARASVHDVAPQGTAAPLRTDTTGVQNRPLSSLGCGKPSPVTPSTSAIERLRSGGRERIYRVHVPRGYTPHVSIPLVLNFHGHGSNAATQERLTGFSILADRHDFLAVYPQGTLGADGWTGWASGGRGRPTSNDVLFVSDLLTKMQADYCVDPQRIYATGFSNGGGMTALLACDLAGRIAAFAPVSGSYYPQAGGCQPGRPVPLLEFHGTRDSVVPYGGRASTGLLPVQSWLSQWAGRDACASAPKLQAERGWITRYTWTGCAAGAEIVHYRIAGWGHHWPDLSASLAGSEVERDVPAASILIWDFFAAHPLPSEGTPTTSATA